MLLTSGYVQQTSKRWIGGMMIISTGTITT
jgi:hypothetical protein